MTDLEIKDLLNCYIKTLKNKDEEFNTFFSLLEEEAEKVYILGGILRNLYFEENNSIRDIDIITKKLDFKKLEKFEHKKNRFGSYKFIFNYVDVDIWDFKENWGYKNKIIKNEGTLEEISKGTFFNIDSLVIDYKEQLLEKRLFERINKFKTIDFTIKKKELIKLNPCPEINILRLLINSEKYKLKLSPQIKNYIQHYIEKDFETKLNQIYESQFKHYKQEKISLKEIRNRLKKIENKRKK